MERIRTLAALVAWLVMGMPTVSYAGIVPDQDLDGIPDLLDKCMFDSRNAVATCDTDIDGYGNPCDADFDQNFSVNAADFAVFFVPAFKGQQPATRGQDMDCNGSVTALDFGNYFVPKFKGANGGAVPGPSGLACAGQPGCQ